MNLPMVTNTFTPFVGGVARSVAASNRPLVFTHHTMREMRARAAGAVFSGPPRAAGRGRRE